LAVKTSFRQPSLFRDTLKGSKCLGNDQVAQHLSRIHQIKDPPFAPYILILTESNRPSSVVMAAAGSGSLKYINLSDIYTATDLPKLQEIVRSQYTEHQGMPLFGKTMGFFFAYSPTEGIKTRRDRQRPWEQTRPVPSPVNLDPRLHLMD